MPAKARIAIERKDPKIPLETWTAFDPEPELEPGVVGTSAGSENVAPPNTVEVQVVVGTMADVSLTFVPEPLGVFVPVAVVLIFRVVASPSVVTVPMSVPVQELFHED